MWSKVIKYLGAGAGFTAFALILFTADYSVLRESLDVANLVYILPLAIISSGMASVSFARIARLEFPTIGNHRHFFHQSLSATLSNFGIPFAGTSSKIASLKSAGIKVSESLRVLVSVSLIRVFAAVILVLLWSPIILAVKLPALAVSLLAFILWSKGKVTKILSGRWLSLQPSSSLQKTSNSVSLLIIDLVSISFSGLVLFALWDAFLGDTSLAVAIFAAGLASLVSVVPISPGAIGTKDSAIFLAFSVSGVVDGTSGALVIASRLVGIIALGSLALFLAFSGFIKGTYVKWRAQ